LVQTLGAYVDREAHGLKRSYVTEEDKSWEAHGVNATALIEEISQIEPHVAAQLKLQAAFGLRVRESFEFRVHRAIKDLHTLHISDGTKGGRPREVPILLQLSVLEEAAQLSNPITGSMVPMSKTMKQWRDHYYHVMDRFGITREGRSITSHGLRHGFLQEYYKRLTGVGAAVKGGEKPDAAVYQEAIQRVVEAAGHSRPSKSGAYLSTHAAMARKEQKKVSPEQAATAVAEAGGNKAHAAKALGVSRPALYRALAKAS
jgi:integrase